MLIGVDARMITHPGIGSYTRNLLANLLSQSSGEEYLLLGDKANISRCLEGITTASKQANYPVYSLREQLFMPRAARGVDLLHVPHYNIPVFYKGLLVSTVHDLIHLIFPQYLPSKFAHAYAKFMYSQVAKKAARIIAVSENTKKDLIEHMSIDAKRIVVTHEGVSPQYRRVDNMAILSEIRQRYNLNKPFILCVGTLRYHKNILNLIEAFLKLKKKDKIEEKLVLVGRPDRKAKRIYSFLSSLAQGDDIQYLGEIEPGHLPYIYNLARAFVMPSFYEGFGLPILEAMACGIPVVASNVSSIPEVAGDGARYVDPHSVEEIASGIYDVLSSGSLRSSLTRKGFERIKHFDWKETARKTKEVYMEALQCELR